jgi:hypothetical protein
MTDISRCAGSSSEVEEAVAPLGYVYAEWIGCGGIGFARSLDGGRHFAGAMQIPGSAPPGQAHALPAEGWDPAIALAPDGTIYVSFMIARRYAHPVIAVSVDHGASFTRVRRVMPPAGRKHNFGDRDFIAVAPNGTVYVTWIYGRNYNPFGVFRSRPVVQRSTNGGRTWSSPTPVNPGFPYEIPAAPLVVEPSGQLDALMWVNGSIRDHHYVHRPADDYFTSSTDSGATWTRPVRLGPPGFRINPLNVFWIDTDIGMDASGVLYATCDTQRPGGDIGWLSYSLNHGRTWSSPIAATLSHGDAEHIMAVVGGRSGVAYVAWETNASHRGWAEYLRPFAIGAGWLDGPQRVAPIAGRRTAWPGDTIGLSVLPGKSGHRLQPLMVSWGVPFRNGGEIRAARVIHRPDTGRR